MGGCRQARTIAGEAEGHWSRDAGACRARSSNFVIIGTHLSLCSRSAVISNPWSNPDRCRQRSRGSVPPAAQHSGRQHRQAPGGASGTSALVALLPSMTNPA